MTKRKLSNNQLRRIKHRQDHEACDSLATPGKIIAFYGRYADVKPIPCDHGSVYRCHLRANIGPLVTGDDVFFQPQSNKKGIITALKPRHSQLHRYAQRGQTQLIAANIDLVVVVIAAQPTPHRFMLDRYLAASHIQGLRPIIVVNKSDLIEPPDTLETNFPWLSEYREMGYEVLSCSTKNPTDMSLLHQRLKQCTSILIGQSGVGKSSLINALIPQAVQTIGSLSEDTLKGRHTTTTSRLLELGDHGILIDSPGIREFSLGPLPRQEIEQGFIEFIPFLGRCKFRDCSHQQEPDCAIQSAVATGLISPDRFASFTFLCQMDHD